MEMMAIAFLSTARHRAHVRRRRSDFWVAAITLVGALLALPLSQSSWHGPEVAAVLAVSATAMLAGQRWAISLIGLAEIMLAPTLAMKIFSGGLALWPGQIVAVAALAATIPGLLRLRRAAAALVLVIGRHRTAHACRQAYLALVAFGMIALTLPIL